MGRFLKSRRNRLFFLIATQPPPFDVVEQQGPTLDQVSAALAGGDTALAERLAHTLKGVAGNTGAVPRKESSLDFQGRSFTTSLSLDRVVAQLIRNCVSKPAVLEIGDTETGESYFLREACGGDGVIWCAAMRTEHVQLIGARFWS